MSSLLIADVVEDNSDDIDTDSPVLDVLVDEVSRQVLLAVAARPNAHHLVGLEYQVGREFVDDLVLRVHATLEHPVGERDVLVARRVLQYDHLSVRRALRDRYGAFR